MKLFWAGLCTIILASCGQNPTSDPTVSPPAPSAPEAAALIDGLSGFEFFAGSCWEGLFSDGQSQDRHCFRPVFDGQFVRDTHDVTGARGPYGGETIFSADPATGRIQYTYWNTSGGISRGEMIPTETGFESPVETYDHPDGTHMKIASRWVITGPDTWEQISEEVSGDTPARLWSVAYQRAPLEN